MRITRDLLDLYEDVSLLRADDCDNLDEYANSVKVYIEPLRDADNPENTDSRFFRGRYRGDVLVFNSNIEDQDVLKRPSGQKLVITRVLQVKGCQQLELQNQDLI